MKFYVNTKTSDFYIIRHIYFILVFTSQSSAKKEINFYFFYFNFYLQEEITSEIILDARCDVLSLISYLGQTSIISMPIIPCSTIAFRRYTASIFFRPNGTGTETPGAKAGSTQSISNEM